MDMSARDEKGPVYWTVRDRIAEIVLNRPEKRNALTLEMWRGLAAAATALARREDVEAVVVRGSGETAFSAGADIGEFATVRGSAEANRVYARAVREAIVALRSLPVPTVAMIRGFCVGGGTEIAVACDLRFAARSARMGITPTKLGFVYDPVETRMLMDLIGPNRAKDLLFSARLVDGEEAYRMGLVDRLYADDVLEAETWRYLKQVTANGPQAIRSTKVIIDRLAAGTEATSPELTAIVDAALDGPEYQEGIRAFVEKRPPAFRRTGPSGGEPGAFGARREGR
ncbi:MAG: enoyl-CoA hydratase/isomerase family protein [Actinomycetia bacterium]|nr:enoyl-CoA hydratase/isomerase family protein [Actinomycetes bacterium]